MVFRHLRGHLHNHNISIEVIVNETITNRKTLMIKTVTTAELNPNIELLRTTFGLDLSLIYYFILSC
jgi:hypothetical protein